MNRIEKSIIASFSKESEQSLSQISTNTSIPKGTIKKYLAHHFKQRGIWEELGL
jgi:hypothetical protein